MRLAAAAAAIAVVVLLALMRAVAPAAAAEPVIPACAVAADAYQPTVSEAARALEQAVSGQLGPDYPSLPLLKSGLPPAESRVQGTVPCVVLKAIAYIESGWRQAKSPALPGMTGPALTSPSCGYGMLQITWGMRTPGELPLETQQRIASDYRFNAAWAARMLAERWNATPSPLPPIGDRDPSVIENWYYAVWAYNKWTAANNPNNPDLPWPRPAYAPGQNKTHYPYQELVWGLAANPPRGSGQLLWEPVALTLPLREAVGLSPQPLPAVSDQHRSACASPAARPAGPTFSLGLPWVTRGYRLWNR